MEFLDAIREQLIQPVESRMEPRMPLGREVTVRMIATGYRVGSATVLDWSVSGRRVRHDLALRAGKSIKLVSTDWVLNMRVVWTACIDGTTQAGLVVEHPVRPDHRGHPHLTLQ
jgi:hypothetical protein